jgi:hypothetical protein
MKTISLAQARNQLFMITILFVLPLIAGSQSLHVEVPAPMRAGNNQAAVDSFVGSHYWFFYAEPGSFHLRFSGGETQEGFTIGGRAVAGAAFGPKTPGATLKWQESASGTTFEGSVKQRTRVVVEVDPRKSPLVRQTTNYILTASGNVSFATLGKSSGATPIVGTYMAKLNDFGAVKFRADGSVVASNGAHGTWTLFDADSGIYSVVLSGTRLTLTLAPGRGLIDSGNRNLYFELQR